MLELSKGSLMFFRRIVSLVIICGVGQISMVPSYVSSKTQTSKSGLRHPGLFLSQSAIDALQSRDLSDLYLNYSEDPRSKSDFWSKPISSPVMLPKRLSPDEKSIKDAAFAAYLNAIAWIASGDERHKGAAIKIMDSWAEEFEHLLPAKGSSAAQVQLEAAWLLPVWANAGEIVRSRDRAGVWDDGQFRMFIRKLYLQSWPAHDRADNWGAAASLAAMSAGVFLNDRDIYNSAIDNIKMIMPKVIDENGLINELKSRDCTHPQYSLTAFVQAALVASNQGDDSLWKLSRSGDNYPILLKGIEGVSYSLIGNSKVRNCRNNGKVGTLLAGYGFVSVKKYESLGYSVELTKKIIKWQGSDESSYQFIGWSPILSLSVN